MSGRKLAGFIGLLASEYETWMSSVFIFMEPRFVDSLPADWCRERMSQPADIGDLDYWRMHKVANTVMGMFSSRALGNPVFRQAICWFLQMQGYSD
jgi:hypothetical protein